MTCSRLRAATIAVLALVGCSSGTDLLPASALRMIERDPGFVLMPAGSKITDQGSRRDCIDTSGDIPATWRELDPAGLSITEVDSFFRTHLPQHDWIAAAEDGPATGATIMSRWSRSIGGRPVVLHIWLEPELVTVNAEVACG